MTLRSTEAKRDVINSIDIYRLRDDFEHYQQSHFTGRITVYADSNQTWTVYLRLGRLIWATGGNNRFRRWQRLMNQHCPNIALRHPFDPASPMAEFWEYAILSILIKKNKIQAKQAIEVIKQHLTEIFFDILQGGVYFQTSTDVANRLKQLGSPIAVVNPIHCLNYSYKRWKKWCELGLEHYSANDALRLLKPDALENALESSMYDKLTQILTGSLSIRETSLQLKGEVKDINTLICTLLSKKIVEVEKIPDLEYQFVVQLQNKGNTLKRRSQSTSSKKPLVRSHAPLILCIDDSIAVGQELEEILTRAGFRFCGIQDSLKALPTLIEKKPQLIFLDLVMPVASGYEICAQIRRMEAFKNTPIIILTGNDGIVDRVRAKLVGATGFLPKPINAEKVLSVAKKILFTPAQSTDEDINQRQIITGGDQQKIYA